MRLRRTLLLFMPFLIVVLFMFFLVYDASRKQSLQQLQSVEMSKVSVGANYLAYALEAIFDDLMFIADHTITNDTIIEHWREEWLSLAKAKPQYDQIRWLDETGQERLRINAGVGNRPQLVPTAQLQNKAGRYYFDDCFALNVGEFFVSPLDLNIEQNQIERPFKPMIRIGTPVYDDSGKKRGIVLINYLGNHALQKLHAYSAENLQVLNRDGYWLKAAQPDDEWGFMFKVTDRSLAHRQSAVWQRIQSLANGQFETADGLWSFTTVYPLKEGMKSSLGSSEAFAPSLSELKRDEFRWIVLTQLTPDQYFAPLNQQLPGQILTLSVVLMFLLLASWILAGAQLKEKILTSNIQNQLVKLQELNSQLLVARDRADEANRAKSEFLSNMSHEIRTPLNGVIGFTELLQHTELSGTQALYVKNANTSGHALLGIINDILDFSKIEAGMMELENLKTDLPKLVEQSIDIVRFQADRKGLELLVRMDNPIPRFAILDAGRLRQVLTNLLGNAVKFTEKGEVELQIAYEVLEAKLGRLTFSVRDTGIGMDSQAQSRLFKAFSQADMSTTRKFGGTGLGLVISNKIVEKMGGSIAVQSQLGQGSTFSFTIVCPVEGGDAPDTTTLVSLRNCLVVDDNDANRTILAHQLSSWGLICTLCKDGAAALETLAGNSDFDVMLCDYHMPGRDGLAIIRKIRSELQLTAEQLPIILLHSSADDATVHASCAELDVAHHMTKPIVADVLFNLLTGINQPAAQQEAIWTGFSNSPNLGIGGRVPGRVLVAEDNSVNMLLATTLISKLLPQAQILQAKNGLEAVAQFMKQKPELILMDVQMPELDGVEASKQIRALEFGTGARVAIIALTAGTTREEEARCLANGMDDFLAKPVEMTALSAIIKRHASNLQDMVNSMETMLLARQNRTFDRQLLLQRLDNDAVAFKEILQAALANYPAYMVNFRRVVEGRDTVAMASLAHQLRGASLSMCFTEMAQFAQQLEQEIRGQSGFDILGSIVDDIGQSWAKLVPQLELLVSVS